MGLKQDIVNKVKSIVTEEFNIKEVSYVPSIDSPLLTFGNTGLRFEATVLYIDMRESTSVLSTHNRATVAKIHMAYFETIVRIAKSLEGEVRSFNGDSMLVFFPGTQRESIDKAVKAALQMVYMITNDAVGINKILAKYSPINFGIGIDYGTILCTKIGVGRDSNNQDLIWIGHAVNKSTVISDSCKRPNYLGISKYVYDNLSSSLKQKTESYWYPQSRWTNAYIQYNNSQQDYYYTNDSIVLSE